MCPVLGKDDICCMSNEKLSANSRAHGNYQIFSSGRFLDVRYRAAQIDSMDPKLIAARDR